MQWIPNTQDWVWKRTWTHGAYWTSFSCLFRLYLLLVTCMTITCIVSSLMDVESAMHFISKQEILRIKTKISVSLWLKPQIQCMPFLYPWNLYIIFDIIDGILPLRLYNKHFTTPLFCLLTWCKHRIFILCFSIFIKLFPKYTHSTMIFTIHALLISYTI